MEGELLALASAVFLGFSTATAKSVTRRIGVINLTTTRIGVSAVLTIVVAAIVGEAPRIAQVPLNIWGILLGTAVIVLVGHIMLAKAITLDDVSRVSPAATGLYVLLSVVISAFLSDETVSLRTAVGGAMVLGGIYTLSIRQREERMGQKEKEWKSGLMALGLASAVGLSWAIGVFIMNEVVKQVEPVTATVIRVPFMALLILGMAAATGNIRRRESSKRDLAMVYASGLLIGASTLTFVSALKWSSPATVVILNSTAPFFVMPLAILWLHERFTRQVLFRTLVCFGGVVLTLLQPNTEPEGSVVDVDLRSI
jgi:drug/metabolite transporter (DMT)-like permease